MSDYPHDVLARKPIRIDDRTTLAGCEVEVRERLEALMDLYECDATPDGWRALATRLIMLHEPAFRVETPFDRQGRDSGRPSGMRSFHIRSEMSKSVKAGATVSEAARAAAKRFDITQGRARNIYYDKGHAPDGMRILNYSLCAHVAIENVAEEMSRK